MSFEPDVAYLAPDFDPASLTVPRLRSILVEYDVPYPASAKKSDLIELFNKSVASKAKQLLKSHSRTKRSARGIEDVPSSQDSTVDEEDEDTILPKPPKTTRSTRRSMRAGTADTEMSTASRTSTARAPAKKMSTKHALPADAEPDLRPAVRRSRNSVQREIKEENTEPETWHRHDAESPFTADNPFQSGSSPPAPESKDYRRRTTLGHVKERPKSSSRRRTEGVPTRPQAKDGIIVPSRKTFEVSFKKTKKEESVDDHGVVAGEEFTPEEQLELIRERAKAGQADILPSRRRKHRSSGVSTAAPVSILMILLSVLAFLWRQEKLEVGYCGVGKGESTSLAGQEIPEWAREFLPSCEACPSHAICYSDLKTECEKDFVLRPHPLSIGGVVPLPPTCEPDSEKARRIKSVADRATMKLRERNAAFECGEKDKSGHHVKSPEMTEEELRSVTSQGLSKKWSQAEFDELWKGAIDDIVQRDEIKAGPVG
ncbi:hypothetical protein M501DRAFT_989186 [Patellaria atrata CBS 101060]|uniref:LEM-like domain-containing protein n=1 Tax=Patellaria atrata CBS 101060 TaxID=1346257 RepID=A0A9P4VMT6_9PEZI|nr:hypothetical protein M501DRAFT_989186 [Patellaria atrata CBS 101060]